MKRVCHVDRRRREQGASSHVSAVRKNPCLKWNNVSSNQTLNIGRQGYARQFNTNAQKLERFVREMARPDVDRFTFVRFPTAMPDSRISYRLDYNQKSLSSIAYYIAVARTNVTGSSREHATSRKRAMDECTTTTMTTVSEERPTNDRSRSDRRYNDTLRMQFSRRKIKYSGATCRRAASAIFAPSASFRSMQAKFALTEDNRVSSLSSYYSG